MTHAPPSIRAHAGVPLAANARGAWAWLPGLRSSFARLGLAVWFVVMLAVGATLLGRHLIALPRPDNDRALGNAMSSLRGADGAGRWMLVHVLYAECLCSQRIAEHVLAGHRPADVAERVLLIGREPVLEARFATMGLPVTVTTEDEAATRFHIVAAPVLVVVAPDGEVRYAAGYTERKQGPDPHDLAILADARAGRDVRPLPVFGCAVSARLRSSINPLRLP